MLVEIFAVWKAIAGLPFLRHLEKRWKALLPFERSQLPNGFWILYIRGLMRPPNTGTSFAYSFKPNDQTHRRYRYTFWMLNRWLLLNFDALGAFSVLITTLLVLGGFIPDYLAGLTITSAMNFTTSVYWTCRMITSLELDLK